MSDPTCCTTAADNNSMTRGDELFMRLLYLKRRTCDQLSRDLTEHALHDLQESNWDDYLNDPKMRKETRDDFISTYFSKYGNRIPRLEECDTTTLFKFVHDDVTRIGTRRDERFDADFKKIKDMRNDSAHDTNKQLTDKEYDSQFQEMTDNFNNLDRQIFKSLDRCLEFLAANKYQSFEIFCRNNPSEVSLFSCSLEDKFKHFLEQIEPLRKLTETNKKLVDNNEKLVDNNEKLVDNNEKLVDNNEKLVDNNEKLVDANKSLTDQLSSTKSVKSLVLKPVSNVPDTTPLAGRDADLKKLKTLFQNVQLVLICGPPGIGKTSLALKYAKESENEETQQMPQGYDCRYLNIEFKDLDFEGKEVYQEVGRAIGEVFPAIVSLPEYKDEPFKRFMEHARELVKEIRLFFILDNLDNVLKAAEGNSVMDRVVRNLSSLGSNIKILATARDKSFSPDYLPFKIVELKPISIDESYNFLTAENESLSHLNDEIMQAIAKYANGIPLILKVIYSHVKRRPDFKLDDLPKIEFTSDWERLERSLDLSFSTLKPFQIEVLQCASLFMGYFDRETLIYVYQSISSDNREDALGSCYDLSLVEFSQSSRKYFLHPYIKRHIRKSMFAAEDRKSVIGASFVVSYVRRLMTWAEKQLDKNKFSKTLKECVNDAKNIEKTLKLINSNDKWQISAFRAFFGQSTSFACFWLLTSFWFLNKIGRFKPHLIGTVEEIENIFKQIDKIDFVVLCKCFTAHQLRLKTNLTNVNKARLKIQEAFLEAESLSGTMADYCKGYVKFSMGRFQQHIETNLTRNYRREFSWEQTSANDHYQAALDYYRQWKPEKSDISEEKFEIVVLVETLHVIMFQQGHQLRKTTEETKRQELFSHFADIIKIVSESLGTHEEVGYSHKKYGDLLLQYDSKDQASETYEQIFKYYNSFGPEIRTQQIEILINWSDCYEDDTKALEKLKMAEAILKEYYLTDHKWAMDVKNRIGKRQRNLGRAAMFSPRK
ncbi:uncharacterized protein LOC142336195 [Convolutriloba macropyga]|uniref:uncharacterized protein LOC142336195 n=1 Tax=Convolutriloba macropyga TaxID=536237 RepID=UPI003F5253F6